MKVGFIFECGPEGPDVQVCRHLVNKLDPTIEFIPITLDNKKNLVEECGAVAKALLEECEKVIVVWYLYPAWREKGMKPCRHEDRQAIFQPQVVLFIFPLVEAGKDGPRGVGFIRLYPGLQGKGIAAIEIEAGYAAYLHVVVAVKSKGVARRVVDVTDPNGFRGRQWQLRGRARPGLARAAEGRLMRRRH